MTVPESHDHVRSVEEAVLTAALRWRASQVRAVSARTKAHGHRGNPEFRASRKARREALWELEEAVAALAELRLGSQNPKPGKEEPGHA